MLRHTVIAEIGQNHCGDMVLARRLICLAKDNGADLVKFQLYDSEKLYGEKQSTELSKDDAFMLFEYGKRTGIEVFFSVFDRERIGWCEEIKVSRYKIACGEAGNKFLTNDVLRTHTPVILSSEFRRGKDSRILVLYCIPKYPATLADLKFNQVDFTKDFQGYSDHTIGLNASYVALARGAATIEKHFAVNHKTGVDGPWSMTPPELQKLRKFADDLELCL